jgi:hypothetical protein
MSEPPREAVEGNWAGYWQRHLPRYLAAPPRCGRWLRWRFDLRGSSILEIAGGSCRDSRYLHASGFDALGSDGDAETVAQAAAALAGDGFEVRAEDASHLSFAVRSFDVTFHNGFWILFADDRQIQKMLVEQMRVTRRHAVAIVHNALNRRLVARFATLATTDPLFAIRFFEPDQIRELVQPCLRAGQRLSIEKFGGVADHGYGIQRRVPGVGAPAAALPPGLYRFQPWALTERIAVVIDMGGAR